MEEKGSVAPKERVNIVYRPATGESREDIELPFKQLVVGDFRQRPDDNPLEESKPIGVDKTNFDEVLAGQNLTLDLSVPNRLEEDGEGEMAVQLSFRSLKDFDPDSLVEQVPELRELIALRDALKALKGPLGNIPDFRRKLQEIIKNQDTRAKLLSELGVNEH